MNDEIKVSILCMAYNHEQYIKSALDSFLMQKTSFEYEIIVHDDASTDGTAEIIKEYAKKYPKRIIPICQKENQYSKGIDIIQTHVKSKIRGEYIAFCEGDDYWIVSDKLQKQYEALEKNQNIDICAHGAIEKENGRIVGYISPAEKECVFPTSEVIKGGGGFVASAALFYRRCIVDNPEPEFRKMLQLDYTLQVMGALRGGMLYFPENMSVYRIATVSSWTRRMRSDHEKYIRFKEKLVKCLEQMDIDTGRKYEKEINEQKAEAEFEILYYKKKYKMLMQEKYKNVFKKKTFKQKIFLIMRVLIKG